jgi:hypothetical protein
MGLIMIKKLKQHLQLDFKSNFVTYALNKLGASPQLECWNDGTLGR